MGRRRRVKGARDEKGRRRIGKEKEEERDEEEVKQK